MHSFRCRSKPYCSPVPLSLTQLDSRKEKRLQILHQSIPSRQTKVYSIFSYRLPGPPISRTRQIKLVQPVLLARKALSPGATQSGYSWRTGTRLSSLGGGKKRSRDGPGQRQPITSDLDVDATFSSLDDTQGLEAGVIPESRLCAEDPNSNAAEASTSGRGTYASSAGALLYPPAQRRHIRRSWRHLMRWSKIFKRNGIKGKTALDRVEKVVVFGGGSFGTAMGAALARQKGNLQVTLLLRDPHICHEINSQHVNTRYLKDFTLPTNVTATTCARDAITGAQYAIHAVPVQHSRVFLESVKDVLAKDVPIISVSKGLELGTGRMMSELIPQVLGSKQPTAFLSGPSFAKEVLEMKPTGFVAASKDSVLAKEMQELFASPYMRINHTSDVIGVEICGALKNVLAIAAGIVEGLDLGHNAMAALVTQGCAEIRWLAEKMGAKSATVAGLSGLGDIMLTCYGSLSRNRSVGVRLGQGEQLQAILESSSQIAEGVSTAGVVVGLARKYRVKLPVLTATAHILDSDVSPAHAVAEIMNLPQIEEK